MAERRLAVEQSKSRYRVLRSSLRHIASDLAGLWQEEVAKIVERAFCSIVAWRLGESPVHTTPELGARSWKILSSGSLRSFLGT